MLRIVTFAIGTSLSLAHVTNIRSAQFGTDTSATADNSVAMGVGTRADDFASLVIGHYNKINEHAHNLHDFQHNGQAFVVGNGHAESDRSNALELDFDGNMHLDGDLTIHDGDHDHISLKDIHDRLEKLEQLLGGCKCSASIFNCQDADALKVQFNTIVSQQNSCDSL